MHVCVTKAGDNAENAELAVRDLGSKPLLVLLIAQTAQSHTKQISSNLPPVGHKVLNHPSQQFNIPSTSTYLLVMFFQCVFASAQILLSFFFLI